MAAIYSGIHLKLKSSKTSWEDKLKLAQFAWISHQCFLPNKEQVLLDWVTHTLVSCYKKLKLSDEIIDKLWLYLDNILRSRKLQSLFKEGKTITLRFSIAQVINERLSIAYTQKNLTNIGTVLSCCNSILSTPPLSIVYAAKFELLVDLLSKLSWLTCWHLSSEDAVSSLLFEVLQLTFRQYLAIQRQQANANRVFGQVTKHLLQPCLLLRHQLIAGVWTQADDSCIRQHVSREIRNSVETLLKDGVFQSELLLSYQEELLPEKESQNPKKGALKNLLLPVSTIQAALKDGNFCQPALHGKVVANSVPLLFKLFLESYSKAENHLVCFHLLTRLFDCLKISCLQDQLLPSEWSPELLALEQLLNSVLSSNIYNVAVDRIQHKEVQFHFYRQLAQMLLNHSQAAVPAWYRCLKALISLNHYIVEPDLDDLVSSAWIDADICEPRTKKAQEALISVLFQTYAKLRQFQKLFQEVLNIICRPAAEELRLPILPVGIRSKLCDCLLDLPPNQILDIVSLILEKCKNFVIPHVKGDSDMALKLHSMSSLLHSILFNMTSIDDSTALPVICRTQSLMEMMRDEIIQALFNLLKNCLAEEAELEFWEEKVGDSALLLTCTWVATDTLFDLNCGKYTSLLTKTTFAVGDSTIKPWDFSVFLPGLEAQYWDKVAKLLGHSSSGSKYCIEWLVLQKMKMILMHSSSQAEASCQTLRLAAAFILHSGKLCMNSEKPEPWDGNAGTVNSLTYPAAHWHLVASNLPILFPCFSLHDALYVADVLLKTMLMNHMQEALVDHDDDSLITVGKVSEDFLRSPLLSEMQVLHSAFISHIVQHCANVLYPTVQNLAHQPLQQLSAENIPWCDVSCGHVASSESRDESSVCWTTMEDVAQNVLALVKERSSVSLEEEHIKKLKNLLEIISLLNLDCLYPLDHARCFVLLVSLAVNTRASVACSEDLYLKYLATCFHLLACLQTGRNVNASFKVWHGSDVLEAILTSMFATCRTFGSALTSAPWDGLLHRIQVFLEHYLQVILERRQSVKQNMEKAMSFLATCQLSSVRDKPSKSLSPAADQLLLVALTAQCHVLTWHLQQQHGKWQASGMLHALLEQAVLQTGAAIQFCLRNITKGQPLPLAFIPYVTTLLKADSCSYTAGLATGDDQQSNPKEPVKYQQLSHGELYRRFYTQIMRELDLAGGNVQFLSSALQFLSVFCSMPDLYPEQKASIAVFHTIRKLLAGSEVTIQVIQDLETPLMDLVAQLVGQCNTDDFCIMLRLVLEGLDVCNVWKQNTEDILSAITLLKVLLLCPLSGEKEKVFWLSSPQIITALVAQAKESSQGQVTVPVLIVPILETVAVLLRQGEGIISNPHHITLVFNILLTVPLDHLKFEDYSSIFLGIHEVLFAILQCHSKVMLKAASSFLNSFHRLVVSITHEGRQKGDRGNTDEFEVIVKCAQLVERMYSYIAAKTEEFTIFSAFIVAQYVIELQKVTLHPVVKKHLTEGIYHILDLCIERDLKFLNASLPMGVREVLKELHRDYTHYHKTLKQGDEKYTA